MRANNVANTGANCSRHMHFVSKVTVRVPHFEGSAILKAVIRGRCGE